MEGSEDDAGTATNASRRASAREKDVGLAEEVNATNNSQKRPSEQRSSGETTAMSEDNFDGDSVPSPSSQDVNTSTEAILDMIDEIVDGPDAPKRLPLPSEFVDELNQEVATTSHNLEIIQESARSRTENITLVQNASLVIVPASSEITLPESTNTAAVCSTQCSMPTNTVNVEKVDSLPASSSVFEGAEDLVSTKTEEIAVSNVNTGTLSSSSLSNIPSSSDGQTLKTISDNSVSELQDRTVKCVTSSDFRDNVTVESAESTSSDSSVSESKPLFVEPQIRSPLRRKLIRPAPSDRRPDSTVSSTVDSQISNDNIPAAEQSSSENIAKDVTSSSDAVPVTHGNVTPEEISNVSEINFCQAETSMSPPKKIKLIRQKSTSIVNREMSLNVIGEREQCQSTSYDNNSVNLSILTKESSNADSFLQSQNVRQCDSEIQLQPSSSNKEIHNEQLRLTKPVPPLINKNDEKQENICKQGKCEAMSVSPSSPEHKLDSLPMSKSSKQITDDSEDYIPLCLPPNSKFIQSKSTDTNEVKPEYSILDSKTVDKGVRSSETESKSSECKTMCNELHPEGNEIGTKTYDHASKNYSDTKVSQLDINREPQPISSDIESKTNVVKLKSIIPESKNIEIDLKSVEPELQSHKLATCDSALKSSEPITESNKLDLRSNIEIKKEDESNCEKNIELQSNMPESKNAFVHSQETNLSLSSEEQLKHSIESNSSKIESKTREICEPSSGEINVVQQKEAKSKHSTESKSSSNESKTHKIDETSIVATNVVQPKNCELQVESGNIQIKDHNLDEKSGLQLKKSELEPSSSTVESQNIAQNNDVEPKNAETELKNRDLKSSITVSVNSQSDIDIQAQEDLKKVPPIKLNLSKSNISESKLEFQHSSIIKNSIVHEELDSMKQVPKLTIKLKQPEEIKSPVPKLTIKPLKPPVEQDEDKTDVLPSVKKINIKPIVKPTENVNDKLTKSQSEVDKNIESNEQVSCITKLNIKPILKPPEKINDVHRKSSSSEISESESSENDDTTSTSDQASASDHGSSDVVPKVTIKLGKPGTESEGKFYTEKNVPKLTIKGIHQEDKVVVSHSDDNQPERVPKLTIKTVTKTGSQPLSPKLTIKPLKPPDSPKKGEISKGKIATESFSPSIDGKESSHVPKITIKPITRMDGEVKTPKKSTNVCDNSEHIHTVTKLNIKPILKPADSGESSESFDDKVPIVSKLNIKPVVKPKDNDLDSSVDDVPIITKLNIKPLKNPEHNTSDKKDCDESNTVSDENSIPVVSKINIKPIVKPQDEDKEKDSENFSSETGNSSDDNADHIPVVTKLNIKPIVKPDELQETTKSVSSSDQNIPVVTKLNIKPLIKRCESSPSSPKKELKVDVHSMPVVTKLNIKPVIKPEDTEEARIKDDIDDKVAKYPPLLMKINMKSVTQEIVNHESAQDENVCNYDTNKLSSSTTQSTKNSEEIDKSLGKNENKTHESVSTKHSIELKLHSPREKSRIQNCVPEYMQKLEENLITLATKQPVVKITENIQLPTHELLNAIRGNTVSEESSQQELLTLQTKISKSKETHINQDPKIDTKTVELETIKQLPDRQKVSSVQNCTLLKKLLENTREPLEKKLEKPPFVNCTLLTDKSESTISLCKNIMNSDHMVGSGKSSLVNAVNSEDKLQISSPPEKVNDLNRLDTGKFHSIQELTDKVIDNITKPLEITISDKITNQTSGQDSPRIILKINKTDHGPSAKIITEESKRPDSPEDYTQDIVNEKQSPKKLVANSRRKQIMDTSLNLSTGKRLRSSRIVENAEKSQIKKYVGKRPPSADLITSQNKEPELNILQAKKLKLGQLLSGNTPLSITPVLSPQTSPTALESKSDVKPVNTLLNNENCAKNGNSKLHNILSNLQAHQMHNTNCSEKAHTVPSDIEFNTSMSSSDTTEVNPVQNSHVEPQQMMINENSDFRELTVTEEPSQDPLEVETVKPTEEPVVVIDIPKPVELTPQPKKRGRPRKVPLSEGAKPAVTLPVLALEERPQRSLRLMRDKPLVIPKPRGRGRGRGRGVWRTSYTSQVEMTPEPAPEESGDRPMGEIDPTSSRIKLPRMTEALDKMPSMCTTPLSSRRRSSETFSLEETPDLKSSMDSSLLRDEFPHTPEPSSSGRARGRGSRGGRGRTPRGRGRGRGGGRGAMYMKETLGIYGRVCGPATTTVQLFEEETCMMDDNATPAKPSHLLDEDSQSSVKSSTNESSKMKKSKFADLFDSNKVWTAADVKEYMWPSSERADEEQKVMMIQEQVAMFLGVKSFKRRYPELKRRTICGEERDYVLSRGLVTEALCDLGITAVDASEVLDIMLSDYPHKYEEFRSHQRQRQLTGTPEESMDETKPEDKIIKMEVKTEKSEQKPDLPKVDPEKTRLDMAAAAIASASEWNARMNAARRGACVDLQSLTVLRPRPAPVAPEKLHLRPPAGFYPHALLPGQYQHSYKVYTPEQLRYFPLNTVLAAPPAPPFVTEYSSESEPDWGSRCSSSEDSDTQGPHPAKRKKLTKVKRVSHAEASTSAVKEEPRDEVVDLCRVCKLRLEANRKYTHERFLVCANCNAKLHPSCVDLNADTIRKCREYPWQCAECKTCYTCRLPADDDKMLFCDLCDRGFHIYCVGLNTVPSGRWHCVECAICKSCGARSPEGLPSNPAGLPGGAPAPAEWHHQTRRGPGGHKVYSHSLCTPCARAYRIGRYCPLCERSFIGPKGTMQLVICKLCDRQLHQECVRQTVSSLNVLDYTCAECRRGGITSRAAAVRLAPRTIATLFMAKRRFNKYAHRQYMQNRLREMAANDPPEGPDDYSVDLSVDPSDALDPDVDAPE